MEHAKAFAPHARSVQFMLRATKLITQSKNRTSMDFKQTKNIDRREFLKRMGAGSLLTAAALTGCKNGTLKLSNQVQEIPEGKMEMRTNPNTGDKVSLLGYGCMRWPTITQNGRTQIDQEAVNELVDYAIAHGLNFFDTAPVYVQGLSEEATGIALKRYPRDKYFISTKM